MRHKLADFMHATQLQFDPNCNNFFCSSHKIISSLVISRSIFINLERVIEIFSVQNKDVKSSLAQCTVTSTASSASPRCEHSNVGKWTRWNGDESDSVNGLTTSSQARPSLPCSYYRRCPCSLLLRLHISSIAQPLSMLTNYPFHHL